MNILKYLINFLNKFYNCLREREELKNYIKQTQKIPLDFEFKSRAYITYSNLVSLCNKYTTNFAIADNQYRTPTIKEWAYLLEKIWIKPFRWQKEIFDCDDFSIFMANRIMLFSKLKGLKYQLAFGIAWSYIHSFNCFVAWNKEFKDYDLYVFEPQNGDIFYPNNSNTYKIRRIMFIA